MSSSQNKSCFVQFKLCQKTSPGEDIHITGNIPSLGLWNVYKSEKMVTNQQDYPLWKSKENILVQQDTEIQYKYLIFRGNKFIRWENNSDNRKVKIGKYCKVVIMDPGSKIVHCISDPNLNNITNSEISKGENNFFEDMNYDEIDLNSIEMYNIDIFSDQINLNNNEEQFILSNKENDLLLENKESKLHVLYEDLNVDNSNSKININYNEINNNILIKNNNSLNKKNSIDNIIYEIERINSQIFNNIIINENQKNNDNSENKENKDLELYKIDSNISEIENHNSGNLPFIENNSSKNIINMINNKNSSIFQKIIICSTYLPVEIIDDKIIPLNDYLYPNLFELKKYNDNIYYIGFIKNSKNINEKNKEIIYNKLKNEYKMFPIDVDVNFKNELFNFYNEMINPYLNNIKINIYNLINNNINTIINKTLYKFNQIIYKTIKELAGKEKTLLLLFEHYFIFVPWLLFKEEKEDNLEKDKMDDINNNISIQYIFLSQIPEKDKFINIPNYQKIIKSLLYSNIICFPSYNNCYKFLNIIKLIDGIEYQANIDGDIVLTININEIQNKDDNNNSLSLINNRNVILRVENIFPDYQMLKSILDEIDENKKCLEIREKIENLIKTEDYLIFVSIDDINYLSFIKIKLSGLKLFIDDVCDEKQKIIFIQIITGESINNINSNLNINEEKQEKENINSLTIEEIYSLSKEINCLMDYKILEIINKDINIYEKLYLLNKADCFLKTSDDLNSPLAIYEFLMVKLIDDKNKKEKNTNNIEEKNSLKVNKSKMNKKEKKLKSDFPLIEYILSNQIKEIPGINKYIYVNPFEIKSIKNGLTKAYRNLINFHKDNNINFLEEHTKEDDFDFIKKFFYNDKYHHYKFNNRDYQNNNSKNNNIIDNAEKIKLNKIDINEVIKDYKEGIKIIVEDKEKEKEKVKGKENNKNKSNNNIEIIAINLDFFLSNYSTKKENEDNEKLSELFSQLISISLKNQNNKIILFSKEDQFDLDDIIQNYFGQNKQKYKDTPLKKLKNLIIASSDGYSFKKISNYFEEEDLNKWAKTLIDSEELKYSEKDIFNNLASYKQNCNNIKIEPKSNKIFIYDDDCNKEQIDIYMDCFRNEIESNETLKHILVVNKIRNGYSIINTLNYKALFISRLIKEIINNEKNPKFILYLGFNQTDEVLYKYLDEKKSSIEKYSKTNIYVYCIILTNLKELKNENISLNKQEVNYKNLYYEDNIDEIISLFRGFADSEIENIKKS